MFWGKILNKSYRLEGNSMAIPLPCTAVFPGSKWYLWTYAYPFSCYSHSYSPILQNTEKLNQKILKSCLSHFNSQLVETELNDQYKPVTGSPCW